jgi:hypothetical protein
VLLIYFCLGALARMHEKAGKGEMVENKMRSQHVWNTNYYYYSYYYYYHYYYY